MNQLGCCVFSYSLTAGHKRLRVVEIFTTSDLDKQTICMAMPSLMATIGRVRSPVLFFCRLWTKVNRIKFACAVVSVVCNAVFRLTISCCVPETFVINLRNHTKILMFFGPPNFGGEGASQIPDRILLIWLTIEELLTTTTTNNNYNY